MSHQMDRNTGPQGKRSRIISPIAQKKPYTSFSAVYDRAMRGAAYSLWAKMALEGYKEATGLGIPNKILDLGCGTCKFWRHLPSQSGIWGVDLSEEMLSEAERAGIRGTRILSDLLSLPVLPFPFDLILSVHDTLNYFLEESQLRKIFTEIATILEVSGVFFFDVSTERNFEKHFDGKILEENYGGTRLLWENEYSKSEGILTTRLRFRNESEETEEIHYHKAYPLEVWKFLLESSGIQILKIGSDYRSWKVSPRADYLNFLCRKA
nr:class I SAM-dependent methyltransferase [Leptospira fluminis]